jgi:antitoxin HigA-1
MPTTSTSKAKTTPAAAKAAALDAPSLAQMRRAPTHPGEILLQEFLEGGAYGKAAAAARAMGWPLNKMSELTLGKRALTVEGALDLEAYTGASAEFWMRLQVRHDLWHAMQARKAGKKAS